MSIRIMSIVWQVKCRTHTEKLVLLALADNANDSGECWPSIHTIAAKCDLTKQCVIDQIRALVSSKRLAVTRATGRVNRYLIPVNAVDQSTVLTSQPHLPPPVNRVDHHQSTALTGPVNGVDPNHQEPSIEPSKEPSGRRECVSTIQGATVIPEELNVPEFRAAWVKWLEHRKAQRKPATIHAQDLQLRKLASLGPQRAVAAIECSIMSGWQGIYEPRSQQRKPVMNAI